MYDISQVFTETVNGDFIEPARFYIGSNPVPAQLADEQGEPIERAYGGRSTPTPVLLSATGSRRASIDIDPVYGPTAFFAGATSKELDGLNITNQHRFNPAIQDVTVGFHAKVSALQPGSSHGFGVVGDPSISETKGTGVFPRSGGGFGFRANFRGGSAGFRDVPFPAGQWNTCIVRSFHSEGRMQLYINGTVTQFTGLVFGNTYQGFFFDISTYSTFLSDAWLRKAFIMTTSGPSLEDLASWLEAN